VVPSPFHGGFGLLSFQGPAQTCFYAYQFSDKLGETELQSSDKDAWACRNDKGVQVSVLELYRPEDGREDQSSLRRALAVEKRSRMYGCRCRTSDGRLSVVSRLCCYPGE